MNTTNALAFIPSTEIIQVLNHNADLGDIWVFELCTESHSSIDVDGELALSEWSLGTCMYHINTML